MSEYGESMRNDNGTEDSCLKPIGEIAQLIEAISFTDFMFLMVGLANKVEKTVDKPLVIGEND